MKNILYLTALVILPLGSVFAQNNDNHNAQPADKSTQALQQVAAPPVNTGNGSIEPANNDEDATKSKVPASALSVMPMVNKGVKIDENTKVVDTSVCHCHLNYGRAPLPQDPSK